MTGVSVEYQLAAWQVRASYANIRFKHDLPIARRVGGLLARIRWPLPAC